MAWLFYLQQIYKDGIFNYQKYCLDIVVGYKSTRGIRIIWYWQDVVLDLLRTIVEWLCDVVDEHVGPEAMAE